MTELTSAICTVPSVVATDVCSYCDWCYSSAMVPSVLVNDTCCYCRDFYNTKARHTDQRRLWVMVTIQCTQEVSNWHHFCCRILAKVLLSLVTRKVAPHFSFKTCREANVVMRVHDDTAACTSWVLLFKRFGFLVGHFCPTTILHSFLENDLPGILKGLVLALKNRVANDVMKEGLIYQGFYAG